MYFWSINRLVRSLGDRDLSEGDAFRYFLANWILLAIGFSIPKVDWNVWDVVVTVATVAITIAGALLCYRANGTAFRGRARNSTGATSAPRTIVPPIALRPLP